MAVFLKKNMRFVVCAAFAIELVWEMYNSFWGSTEGEKSSLSVLEIISLCGLVLIAVSAFMEKFNLLAVGAMLQIPDSFSATYSILHIIILMAKYGIAVSGNFYGFIAYFLSIACSYFLLAVSCIKKKHSMKICIVAGIVNVIGLVVLSALNYHTHGEVYFEDAIATIMRIVPIIFAGLMIAKNYEADTVMNNEEQNTIKEVDYLDGILQLKELLDLGLISQEEFEEKKKQLLDL